MNPEEYKQLSKYERATAHYNFIMAAITTAVAGGGVYIATAESSPAPGMAVAGLAGYVTVASVRSGVDFLQSANQHWAEAESGENGLFDGMDD